MELTKGQKTALSLLADSSLRGKFYWTGGTLLAYEYLQHRFSEDLDFFSEESFPFDEINNFIQDLKEKGHFGKVEYQKIFDRHQFLLKNKEELKIEFVHYNHDKKRLGKKREVLGVWVDSLEDLAANKALAYFDRNEPKDLFDIYFLLTKGKFSLKKLLELALRKFGVKLPESLFWSEAFKKIGLLSKIKPLLLEKDSKKKQQLLDKVERYFKEKSVLYLRKNLQ